MNIAVIFAGGTGQRMNTKGRPKQFLELHGKPLLIYTLEIFQNSPSIDGIILVMLESWILYSESLIERFRISKVKSIVAGGETGQESIYRGVERAYELYPDDSVVLVHDGVRPIIDAELISNNINSVKEFGNAISVSGATETVCLIDSDNKEDHHINKILNRNKCYIGRAPQSFHYSEIMECHKKAIEDNYTTAIDSASMLEHYGHKLFFVPCSHFNIKITTPTDLYLFQCYEDTKNRIS